jgi:5'/3'-nucleotidase SurE
MRFNILALLPLAAQAVNIISSNDDGWAEVNLRAIFESLGGAGHSVVVSAPAENQSGTGMCCASLDPAVIDKFQDPDRKPRQN